MPSPRASLRVLLTGLLFALTFGLAWLGFRALQPKLPFSLGVDLLPRWVGSQAMLEGLSPYSLPARQRIWQLIYGSPETPQGNPFGFYYPPAISALLLPFILLGLPAQQAAVLWCALLFSLWLFVLAWQGQGQKPLGLALFLLSGLVFRPAFANYLLGQTALFGMLAFGAAWRLAPKKPLLAGVLLALSLLKPSFLLLPVSLLLLLQPRLRLWLAFGLSLAILLLPSFWLIGWWIPDFLREISLYSLENVTAWSPGRDIPAWTGLLWLGLSLALAGLTALRRQTGLFLAAALCLNTALVPHTADYDLVALLGLLAWLHKRLPSPFFLLLVWFPWLALLALPGVESWYTFSWRVYPSLLLALSLLLAARESPAPAPQGKKTVHAADD